jgi:cytochrome c-type biogenesis protein CcmH/NrfG
MYAAPRLITDEVWLRLDERPPGCGFEAQLLPIWAERHNRKNAQRHQQELQQYRDRIDELQRARVNGHLWSGRAGSDPWHD